MNRSKPIQPTLWDIERRFGTGVLTTAAALRSTHISTGFSSLDALLEGGGIAAGQMTALLGVPTSGATTLLYHLIAQAQGNDRVAAYIDTTASFDAESATACGIHLERLLLVSTADSERALNMTLDLVRVDQAALIALHWQGSERKALERLQANVIRTRTVLVLLRTQVEPIDPFYTLLHLAWKTWLINDNQVIEGYQVSVQIKRDGGSSREKAVDLTIRMKGSPA